MNNQSITDCVVIGYNEVDFNTIRKNLEKTKKYSGAYDRKFRSGSVYFRGQRINYMNLLNTIIHEKTGEDPNLHVLDLPNLAVVYLKSYLAQRDFQVEIINFFNNEKEKLKEILRTDPNAIAISTSFYGDSLPVKEIVEFIREYNTSCKIVVGGAYIHHLCYTNEQQSQEYIFRDMGADVYVNEVQGELTLSKILTALRNTSSPDLSQIPNIIYTENNDTFTHTEGEKEDNKLDDNIVNWDHFDINFYTPTAVMRTAIGCPFRCAFCNYPFFTGDFKFSKIETIEKEMKQLKKAGVKYLQFIDDSLNVPIERFKEMCRMMIRNKFEFKWFSYFRCSHSDDEVYDLMKESGCMAVFLGVETGDQSMLDRMNKCVTIEKYVDSIRKLKESDIIIFVSLIIGFPGETEETVQNTIDFMNKTCPDYYDLELYYHGTTTPIHKKSEKYGIKGAGYGWHHNTMDWRAASDHITDCYKRITGSTIMPEQSFSMYAIPYLLSKGLSLEKIIEFVRITHDMMTVSLDDSVADTSEQERLLLNMFADSPSKTTYSRQGNACISR